MRVVLGILTAAACAAAATMWLSPRSADTELAVVSGVEAGGVARVVRPAPPLVDRGTLESSAAAPRFFGFALPFGGQERPVSSNVAAADRDVAPAAATTTVAKSWTTDVVVYPAGREPGAAPGLTTASHVLSGTPVPERVSSVSRDRPRHELVRDLQRELRRIGCYVGEIDGEWGPGSRRSMRAFMERVNSNLQGDDPDVIQLTLMRGYSGNVCRPTPTQAPAVPGLITAGRQPTPPVQAAPREQLGIAAPVPVIVPRNPVMTGSIEAPAAVPLSGPGRVVPLEGRMAVGAPLPDGGATVGPPLGAGAVPDRAYRPRPAQPPARQTQSAYPRRSDRSWTANFFQ